MNSETTFLPDLSIEEYYPQFCEYCGDPLYGEQSYGAIVNDCGTAHESCEEEFLSNVSEEIDRQILKQRKEDR